MSRLVKKIRYGKSFDLDFSRTETKKATIHIERDTYSSGFVKVVIEADRSIPITDTPVQG